MFGGGKNVRTITKPASAVVYGTAAIRDVEPVYVSYSCCCVIDNEFNGESEYTYWQEDGSMFNRKET